MKFRTRLIISFAIIIFVPLILAGLLMYGVYFIHTRGVAGSGQYYSIVTDSIQVMSKYTTSEYKELTDDADKDPARFIDASYLQAMNDKLRQKYSYMIVRVEGQTVFDGSPEDTTVNWADLPDYGNGTRMVNALTYIDAKDPTVLRQVDFTLSDGSRGSAYLISTATDMLPEIRTYFWDFILSVLIILIMTAIILVAWIYRGIVPPLRQLSKAADNIKEGNLDVPVAATGGDEFSHLCNAFEDMRIRLKDNAQEKLDNEREQKQLISNIAHDLKTPITAIKGYSEGLLDGVAKTPEKQEAYIRTIASKADEMNSLINELTTYSSIDTNKIPYNFRHLKVKDYFKDCADELSMDLESHQITLSYYNYTADDTEFIGDPEQLTRVIHNIASNSVKYMGHDGGQVNMRIKDVGDFIQVEMEDDGQGIPAGDLPYIFDRTFRGDASRNSQTGGSGIGLAVVRKIIEDHGGKVWATSKVGVGTVVYFVLRKYIEEEEEI